MPSVVITDSDRALFDAEESRYLTAGLNVSWFLQVKLRSIESRVILVDEAVASATLQARDEHRIVHPPKYLCEQCLASFPDKVTFQRHQKDSQRIHQNTFRRQLLDEERFKHIRHLYSSDVGRKLRANRLIFSRELGLQQARIDAARPEPYRPQLSDPSGTRHDQFLRGMFVTGFDPKSGLRPNYRRTGMRHLLLSSQSEGVDQQAAAAGQPPRSATLTLLNGTKRKKQARPIGGRTENLPTAVKVTLDDVLMLVNRCHDEFVDVVSTQDHPSVRHLPRDDPRRLSQAVACVRFEWSGQQQARHGVALIGEFTGWKPIKMFCDAQSGVFFHIETLSVGRYRYRFVIDDVQQSIDPSASQTADKSSPLGVSNEVLVTQASVAELVSQTQRATELAATTSKTMLSTADDQSVMTQLTQHSIFNNLLDGDAIDPSDRSIGRILHITQSDPSSQTAWQSLTASLARIDLRNQAVQDDGCYALGRALRHNSCIHEIDLSFNSISDEGVQSLAGGLAQCLGLHTLQLNGNGFGIDALRYLVHSFIELHGLVTQDYLKKRKVRIEALRAERAMQEHKLVRTKRGQRKAVMLKAAGQEDDDNSFEPLKEVYMPLRRLELSDNRLGCDGTEVLSSLLRAPYQSLRTLFLDSCYVGDDGAKSIAQALLHNRYLQHLSLMHNRVGVSGIRAIAEALHRNASLLSLNVSHNVLGPLGVRALGDMLYHNDTLRKLSLRHVDMLQGSNSSGLQAICYGLKHAKSMFIGQSNQGINAEGEEEEGQLRGLHHLDLSHNEMGNIHLIDLAYALVTNTSVTELLLDANTFDRGWLDPEKTMQTHILAEMPSIAMSLLKNSKLQKQLSDEWHWEKVKQKKMLERGEVPSQSPQHGRKLIVDDVAKGYWTVRRQWKAETEDAATRQQRVKDEAYEFKRIQDETEVVAREVEEALRGISHYLDDDEEIIGFHDNHRGSLLAPGKFHACAEDLIQIGRLLTQHMEDMVYFDPDEFRLHRHQPPGGNKGKKRRPRMMASLQSEKSVGDFTIYDNDSMKLDTIDLNDALEDSQETEEEDDDDNGENNRAHEKKTLMFLPKLFSAGRTTNRPSASRHHPGLGTIARQRIPNLSFFIDCHLAVLSSVFTVLSGQSLQTTPRLVLTLHPERLVQCLQMLALPLHLLPLPDLKVLGGGTVQDALQSIAEAVMLPADESAASVERRKPVVALHHLSDFLLHHAYLANTSSASSAIALVASSIASAVVPHISRRRALPVEMTRPNTAQFQLQRLGLLSDLKLHPPLREARTLLLDSLRHRAYQKALDHYAAKHPLRAPRFVCPECKTRFTSEDKLYKHLQRAQLLPGKGTEQRIGREGRKGTPTSAVHRRCAFKALIHDAQYRVLVQSMEEKLQVKLPAYYALSDDSTLYPIKDSYFPQVLDTLGRTGRPIGVIENYRTVRVDFALGDYLQVQLRNESGWVKYRHRLASITNSAQTAVYVPLLRPLPGFDWTTAGGRAVECYYRVNDNLPSHIQLKVRYRPYLTEVTSAAAIAEELKEKRAQKGFGGEEVNTQKENVLGYIGKEDVVFVRFILGDWLQIVYKEEYVAWVLYRLPESASSNDESATAGKKLTSTLSKTFNNTFSTRQSTQSADNAPDGPLEDTFVSNVSGKSRKRAGFVMVSGEEGRVALSSTKVRQIASPGRIKQVPTNTRGSSSSSLLPDLAATHHAVSTTPQLALSNVVRQRKLDHGDIPLGLTAANPDAIFQDDILTYEVEGKFHKAHLNKPGTLVSRYKVHVFDRLRYGNPPDTTFQFSHPAPRHHDPTSSTAETVIPVETYAQREYDGLGHTADHLLRLPKFLHPVLRKFSNEMPGKEGAPNLNGKRKSTKKEDVAVVDKDDNGEDSRITMAEVDKKKKQDLRTAAIDAVKKSVTDAIKSPLQLTQRQIFDAVMAISERDLQKKMDEAFHDHETEEEAANRMEFVRDEMYAVQDDEDRFA